MCIATEQVCESCGEIYWQGDLREDVYLKCDECRGRKTTPKKAPLTRDEWLESIRKLQR